MPSSLLHVETLMTCLHKGTVTIKPSQSQVKVGGKPVATMRDIALVEGCKAPDASLPPCLSVGWIDVAKKVRVLGSPVLLANSMGVGQAAPVPGGSPLPVPNGKVDIIDPVTPVKGT